jgi:hypothetical protein
LSIAIVFHKEMKSEQDYILKRFQNDGFLISKNSSIAQMVLIAATDEMLEKEAERINLLIHNAKGILQHFQIENRKVFKGFKTNEMFKPSEKNLLLLSLMEQVTLLYLQRLAQHTDNNRQYFVSTDTFEPSINSVDMEGGTEDVVRGRESEASSCFSKRCDDHPATSSLNSSF